jgi:hypothetical protein
MEYPRSCLSSDDDFNLFLPHVRIPARNNLSLALKSHYFKYNGIFHVSFRLVTFFDINLVFFAWFQEFSVP